MFKNVFSSGFVVRTCHVILTWIVTLILFLHDTDLKKQQESGHLLQPLFFVLLVLVSVLLYFSVSLMDPGFIHSSDDSNLQFVLGGNDEQENMIPPPVKSLRQRRCRRCLVQQPMRSKHCHTCQRCVRRYDHHCPWIENCIGERNHRWFILYLLLQLLVLTWGCWLCWTGLSVAPSWRPWLSSNGVLLAVAALLALLAVVVLMLLGSHLYLISVNTTTWEFMSRHRVSYLKHCGPDQNPFDRGAARNLRGFFCGADAVAWETLYFREANDV
ncbi:palmitoyltransferase ZDHHC12-B [Cololabis saira]|uniref:palmitoyltransferase ZDHHC12-B n=1 Tax=Cololabis saira TaxID=129043 RepID=UPI002AD24D19|nr:palmitoyltransferase ZDHHC12-B [Cololabis saira]